MIIYVSEKKKQFIINTNLCGQNTQIKQQKIALKATKKNVRKNIICTQYTYLFCFLVIKKLQCISNIL